MKIPFHPSTPSENLSAHQEITVRFMAAMLANPSYINMQLGEMAITAMQAADALMSTYNASIPASKTSNKLLGPL